MSRLARFVIPGAALAASLALAACVPPATSNTASSTTAEGGVEEDRGFIPGGKYVLVGMDGAAVPLRNISLEIKETSISGTGPCNGYGAVNTVELPAVALTQFQTTNATCKDSKIENRYLTVLQAATNMEYYGGVLKVKSPSTWLIFERGVRADSTVTALDAARGAAGQ